MGCKVQFISQGRRAFGSGGDCGWSWPICCLCPSGGNYHNNSKSQQLAHFSFAQGQSRVAVEGETPWGEIELRLQTKDRCQVVFITVFQSEQMKEVMGKYVMKSGFSRKS